MSLIYIVLINIILIFIFFVVLNSKIKKNSAPSLLGRYTKEVEKLVVELNRAVDNAVNISEDRIDELKKLIKRAQKIIKDPKVEKYLSSSKSKNDDSSAKGLEKDLKFDGHKNLIDKTKHLLAMGYSKEDIIQILKISRSEADFLESLNKR